jgi:hypothetical protein
MSIFNAKIAEPESTLLKCEVRGFQGEKSVIYDNGCFVSSKELQINPKFINYMTLWNYLIFNM